MLEWTSIRCLAIVFAKNSFLEKSGNLDVLIAIFSQKSEIWLIFLPEYRFLCGQKCWVYAFMRATPNIPYISLTLSVMRGALGAPTSYKWTDKYLKMMLHTPHTHWELIKSTQKSIFIIHNKKIYKFEILVSNCFTLPLNIWGGSRCPLLKEQPFGLVFVQKPIYYWKVDKKILWYTKYQQFISIRFFLTGV